MNARVRTRLLVVWVVLSAMTACYLWIDHAADRGGAISGSAVVTCSAIVIALIKVRIIFREFMDVRHAPVLLCRLTDAWVVLIGSCLLGGYFIGPMIG